MNLMVALAVLAVLVLVALVAHGIWSARRAGPKRASTSTLREEPREPVLDDIAAVPPATDDGELAALRAPRRSAARLDALTVSYTHLTLPTN